MIPGSYDGSFALLAYAVTLVNLAYARLNSGIRHLRDLESALLHGAPVTLALFLFPPPCRTFVLDVISPDN